MLWKVLLIELSGIGERKAIKNDPKAKGFQKPDLAVIDVDLTGVLYTAFLAVQQMRRQEKDQDGFRGKSELLYLSRKMYHADNLDSRCDGVCMRLLLRAK